MGGVLFSLTDALFDWCAREDAKPLMGPRCKVKRALLAVKGVVESLGTVATNEAVKVWSRSAVTLVLSQLSGQS